MNSSATAQQIPPAEAAARAPDADSVNADANVIKTCLMTSGREEDPATNVKSTKDGSDTSEQGGGIAANDDGGADGAEDIIVPVPVEMTYGQLTAAVNEMDDNLDEAFGHAADSIWNFATSVSGKVTDAVKEGPPGLEQFRKNVTSRLAPLDHLGRDISSHIGALAPTEESLANITAPMKSVAETVQRNAQAMEAAILAKANNTEDMGAECETSIKQLSLQDTSNLDVGIGDDTMGVFSMMGKQTAGDPNIDVNEEIAKVGETISNSLVGQTVGGLWSGLWGNVLKGDEHDEDEENRAADLPKTRFEKKVFELQANPDTYCEPAKDLDAFGAWSKSFVLDENANTCIAILDSHDSIAALYEKVVPHIVDEDTFWMRYFFARHVLDIEEERRKKLMERAEIAVVQDENEDDDWGDDDWDGEPEISTDVPKTPADDEDESTSTTDLPSDAPSANLETAVGKSSLTPHAEDVEGQAAESIGNSKTPEAGEAREQEAKPPSTPGSHAGTEEKLADDWGEDDWE